MMTTSFKLISVSRVNSVIVIIVSHDVISTGDPLVTFPGPDPGNSLQTQTSDLNLGHDVSLPESPGQESSGEVRVRRPRKLIEPSGEDGECHDGELLIGEAGIGQEEGGEEHLTIN